MAGPGPPIGRDVRLCRCGFGSGSRRGSHAQVVVADGFAGGQRAVAKHQERICPGAPAPPGLDSDLNAMGRNDGNTSGRVDQRPLKRQLGLLEGQQRFLHADGRQQHHRVTPAPRAASSASTWAWSMAQASRGRQCARPGMRPARQNARPGYRLAPASPPGVTSPKRTVAPGRWRALSSTVSRFATPARGRTRHHLMALAQQGAHRGLADGAGGAEHEDAGHGATSPPGSCHAEHGGGGRIVEQAVAIAVEQLGVRGSPGAVCRPALASGAQATPAGPSRPCRAASGAPLPPACCRGSRSTARPALARPM